MNQNPKVRAKKASSDQMVEVEESKATDVLKKAFDKLLSAPVYTNPTEAYESTMASIKPPPKEEPVTRDQWESLYEVTKNIRLIAPWEYLRESERITLLLPGRDEPVYIVVMGNAELTYGIGIYPGYDSFGRLLRMTASEPDEDDISIAFEQHCINLYFGDREELESRDKNVIKQLGLKFRGRNEWPYFRSMKPGFMPWYINHEEAELTIAALQNFAMAFIAYLKQDRKIDFEGGETILRFFDSGTDLWFNSVVEMPPVPFIRPKLMITDDLLIARLKKKQKIRAKLGFAMTYLPVPIQDRNERPKIPRMAVLIDLADEKIIDHTLDTETEFVGKAITEMLSQYITECGIPTSITVQNGNTGCFIADFTEKLGIKLVEDKDFSAANNVISVIMNMMESGADLGF